MRYVMPIKTTSKSRRSKTSKKTTAKAYVPRIRRINGVTWFCYMNGGSPMDNQR